MEQIKKRENQLLALGFERNEHQQSWITFKYDQNWYVDFNKVLEYNNIDWIDCIESIKGAYTRAKNKIEWSELYLLGEDSAKKELKQKITNLLNKYKSKLQEETQEKIGKRINYDKINEILNKLSVLNELEDKL